MCWDVIGSDRSHSRTQGAEGGQGIVQACLPVLLAGPDTGQQPPSVVRVGGVQRAQVVASTGQDGRRGCNAERAPVWPHPGMGHLVGHQVQPGTGADVVQGQGTFGVSLGQVPRRPQPSDGPGGLVGLYVAHRDGAPEARVVERLGERRGRGGVRVGLPCGDGRPQGQRGARDQSQFAKRCEDEQGPFVEGAETASVPGRLQPLRKGRVGDEAVEEAVEKHCIDGRPCRDEFALGA